MARIVSGRLPLSIAKRLADSGLLPPNCRNVELSIPADGAMVLKFEVFATTDHLTLLAEAFIELAERKIIDE